MPTIDTVRKMVPLAKELLMKLGDDCGDDERAFDRKVKELTDVLGRRRGLIHDLHDGAIDLDTLLEDAARAAAAAPAEPAATAAHAEGPDSKMNRYVVLMENIMLKALGISMSTIDNGAEDGPAGERVAREAQGRLRRRESFRRQGEGNDGGARAAAGSDT
jgi:hypothetical protein